MSRQVEIKNELTEMLGVRYPIIQGAMGMPGTGTSKIAVPVSQAGALGIMTTIAYQNPEEFQEDLQRARSLTDRPLAVNFSILEQRGGYAFHEPYVKIALDQGIRIAFTSAHAGHPIGKRFQQAGGVWIHKCATVRHAVSSVKHGPDAIVIVGLEGTGFKSPEQNSTLINMTAGRKLIELPLIAAGGIGDGYGLVAALAMGAVGVYLGTGFIATREFPISDKYKQMILDTDVRDADYVQKIYRMDHNVRPSLAGGVIDSIPTVAQYIERIMSEAEAVMARLGKWGMA